MKIKPLCEMYNVKYRIYCNPGVPVDVPDELAQEYIAAGNAVPVEEKARAEPTPEPSGNPGQLPEAEKPKKPRTSKAKKTT